MRRGVHGTSRREKQGGKRSGGRGGQSGGGGDKASGRITMQQVTEVMPKMTTKPQGEGEKRQNMEERRKGGKQVEETGEEKDRRGTGGEEEWRRG